MPVFTDMLGREVALNAPPKRIVSLVPSQTELLYDLGLEDEVVGITKFCIHPESWFRSKERVGGTKNVHPEKVAALKPDLIIANKEENNREQIEALQSIAPVWVSDVRNLESALEMILLVGMLCNRMRKAKEMAAAINNSFAALPPAGNLPPRLVAYGIWRAPWMWAGGDTFITDILRRINCLNVLATYSRYPELPLEDLQRHEPELVLLSSEPYPFSAKHLEEVSAVLPQAGVQLVDGELISWYGSRLLHTAAYLKNLIAQTS